MSGAAWEALLLLSRDLLRLLSDERPRLGWWFLLVVLSVGFAVLELVGSLAILSLLRLFLVTLAIGLIVILFIRAALLVIVSYLGARLSTMASVRISRRLLSGHLHLPYVEHILNRFILQVNEIRSNQVLIEELVAERDRLAVRTTDGLLPEAAGPPMGSTWTPSDIEFRDVSFAYPSPSEGPPVVVLRSVDLRIPSGSFVGIVGPTGGGKSTLLDLLVGLVEPRSRGADLAEPRGRTAHGDRAGAPEDTDRRDPPARHRRRCGHLRGDRRENHRMTRALVRPAEDSTASPNRRIAAPEHAHRPWRISGRGASADEWGA